MFRPRSANRWRFYWDVHLAVSSGADVNDAQASLDRAYTIWEQIIKGVAASGDLGVTGVVDVMPGKTTQNGVWGVQGRRETRLLVSLEIETKGLGGP